MGSWKQNYDFWGRTMTHHYTDQSSNTLNVILERLKENDIFYYIEVKENLIINVNTEDTELLEYALNNNPSLAEVE